MKRLLQLLLASALVVSFVVMSPEQALAADDSVTIVSVSPSSVANYHDEVTFTVSVEYTLASCDNGIVYLGFNTDDPKSYSLVDTIQVNRGSGCVTLTGKVIPAGWGTPDSPSGALKGGLEAAEGLSFGAYVNISEYPHADSWNPLDTDVKAIAQGTAWSNNSSADPTKSESSSTTSDPKRLSIPNGLKETELRFWSTHADEGNHLVSYDVYWGSELFKDKPGVYNKRLAIVAAALSCAAYGVNSDSPQAGKLNNVSTITYSLQNMGFNNIEPHNYLPDTMEGPTAGTYPQDEGEDTVGYTFAHSNVTVAKQEYTLIVVAVRGTIGTIPFSEEWRSNLNNLNIFIKDFEGAYPGFKLAEKALYTELVLYLQKHDLFGNDNNLFFITGHSRGAAVANLLAAEVLATDWPHISNRVYTYCFATPNVAEISTITGGKNKYPLTDIINVIKPEDIVIYVPFKAWGYSKYGTVVMLPAYYPEKILDSIIIPQSNDYFEYTYYRDIAQNEYNLITKGKTLPETGLSTHNPEAYLAWVKAIPSPNTTNGILYYGSVACPVDVALLDSSGNTLARTNGGEVDPSSTVPLFVDGDDKYFALPYNDLYTVKLFGTDDGAMDLTVTAYDYANDSEAGEKRFRDVSIAAGKELSFQLVPPPEIKLFSVMDGVQVSEIMEDGSEVSLIDQEAVTVHENEGLPMTLIVAMLVPAIIVIGVLTLALVIVKRRRANARRRSQA
ncbi:MAG: hypothetical protein LBD25_03005 [Coriobacteriales bacterium]|nr:hypothetical protein [Coriobacteriales bacterium]